MRCRSSSLLRVSARVSWLGAYDTCNKFPRNWYSSSFLLANLKPQVQPQINSVSATLTCCLHKITCSLECRKTNLTQLGKCLPSIADMCKLDPVHICKFFTILLIHQSVPEYCIHHHHHHHLSAKKFPTLIFTNPQRICKLYHLHLLCCHAYLQHLSKNMQTLPSSPIVFPCLSSQLFKEYANLAIFTVALPKPFYLGVYSPRMKRESQQDRLTLQSGHRERKASPTRQCIPRPGRSSRLGIWPRSCARKDPGVNNNKKANPPQKKRDRRRTII